jgi:hypothetical protein
MSRPVPHREQLLDLSALTRDDRLRFRDQLHEASGQAQRYAEAMLDYGGWGEFPPTVVVELTEPFTWTEEVAKNPRYPDRVKAERREYPAGTLVLVGGFTRTAAMASLKEAGGLSADFDPRVPCRIQPGTWADALKLAWRENSHHGQRRSTEETEAVLRSIHADPDHAAAGEREVALLAGCSRATVNRWRAKQRQAEARLHEPPKPPVVNPVPDTPFVPPVVAYQPEPAPAPKPSPTAAAPLLRDEWGRPVPAHVAPMWECVGLVKRAARDIRAACLALGAAKHGPDGAAKCLSPGLALVDVAAVTAAGYTAADLLDSQGPFLVCPQCDAHGDHKGKTCKLCGGHGVLTRPQADCLPPQLETVAKSFRGAH